MLLSSLPKQCDILVTAFGAADKAPSFEQVTERLLADVTRSSHARPVHQHEEAKKVRSKGAKTTLKCFHCHKGGKTTLKCFHCHKGGKTTLKCFHCYKGGKTTLKCFHCHKGGKTTLKCFHCYKGGKTTLKCFHCHKERHFKNSCPLLRQQNKKKTQTQSKLSSFLVEEQCLRGEDCPLITDNKWILDSRATSHNYVQ